MVLMQSVDTSRWSPGPDHLIEPWAEYWSEIEEAVQERYGVTLAEFLVGREPLILPIDPEDS